MPENMDITDDELTVQDILDQAEDAPYHTILEIWREIMASADIERNKRITPQWANRITSSYRELGFADMVEYKQRYFDKIDELRAILHAEIDSDSECLNLTSPAEDAEINAFHYINILINWQKAFLYWELQWSTDDPMAAIELASISEIHRMMFDTTGLTSLLDNIPFEFSEESQQLLATTLQELAASAQEG